MSGVIFYKFKASIASEKLTFDGHFITVGELKRLITEKKKLSNDDTTELVLSDPRSGQDYTDDTQQLPRNTSVQVRRAPVARHTSLYPRAAAGKQRAVPARAPAQSTQSTIADADFDGELFSDKPVEASTPADEQEALAKMLQGKQESWQQEVAAGAMFGRGRGRGRGRGGGGRHAMLQLPCERCGKLGHYTWDCPDKDDVKRVRAPVGIPMSRLAVNKEGGLVLPGGQVGSLMANEDAFAREMAALPTTNREQTPEKPPAAAGQQSTALITAQQAPQTAIPAARPSSKTISRPADHTRAPAGAAQAATVQSVKTELPRPVKPEPQSVKTEPQTAAAAVRPSSARPMPQRSGSSAEVQPVRAATPTTRAPTPTAAAPASTVPPAATSAATASAVPAAAVVAASAVAASAATAAPTVGVAPTGAPLQSVTPLQVPETAATSLGPGQLLRTVTPPVVDEEDEDLPDPFQTSPELSNALLGVRASTLGMPSLFLSASEALPAPMLPNPLTLQQQPARLGAAQLGRLSRASPGLPRATLGTLGHNGPQRQSDSGAAHGAGKQMHADLDGRQLSDGSRDGRGSAGDTAAGEGDQAAEHRRQAHKGAGQGGAAGGAVLQGSRGRQHNGQRPQGPPVPSRKAGLPRWLLPSGPTEVVIAAFDRDTPMTKAEFEDLQDRAREEYKYARLRRSRSPGTRVRSHSPPRRRTDRQPSPPRRRARQSRSPGRRDRSHSRRNRSPSWRDRSPARSRYVVERRQRSRERSKVTRSSRRSGSRSPRRAHSPRAEESKHQASSTPRRRRRRSQSPEMQSEGDKSEDGSREAVAEQVARANSDAGIDEVVVSESPSPKIEDAVQFEDAADVEHASPVASKAADEHSDPHAPTLDVPAGQDSQPGSGASGRAITQVVSIDTLKDKKRQREAVGAVGEEADTLDTGKHRKKHKKEKKEKKEKKDKKHKDKEKRKKDKKAANADQKAETSDAFDGASNEPNGALTDEAQRPIPSNDGTDYSDGYKAPKQDNPDDQRANRGDAVNQLAHGCASTQHKQKSSDFTEPPRRSRVINGSVRVYDSGLAWHPKGLKGNTGGPSQRIGDPEPHDASDPVSDAARRASRKGPGALGGPGVLVHKAGGDAVPVESGRGGLLFTRAMSGLGEGVRQSVLDRGRYGDEEQHRSRKRK